MSAPNTPDDFDPLAALESMINAPAPASASTGWGDAVQIPVCLDTLAAGLAPGETPKDLIERARREALRASGLPVPELNPCRSISGEPSALYTPSPSLPFPFDGSDPLAAAAIVRLVRPATDSASDAQRSGAALKLVSLYESRHGAPLSFPDALILWWKAARRLVDVSELLGCPGLSPNAVRMRVMRPAADAFADAKAILPSARPALFNECGIPTPTLKKKRNGYRPDAPDTTR